MCHPCALGRSAHTRIIWGIAWSPDDRFLATGARDEAAKLWSVSMAAAAVGGAGDTAGAADQQESATVAMAVCVSERPAAVLMQPCAVHSLAFAPMAPGDGVGDYLLATGLEDGNVNLWRVTAVDAATAAAAAPAAQVAWRTDDFTRHAATVNSVCWRMDEGDELGSLPPGGKARLQLASCGDDHSVRVYDVVV